ncbi:RDD family protein [Clostridium sardiniense]|uniref:RDD family protein n=1 Tax=Clostridium sardiniense TaxID=29369 RepID=UPI003D341CF0
MSKKEGMDINNQEDTNVEEVVESLELKKEEGSEEEEVKEDIIVESTDEEETEEKNNKKGKKNKEKIIVEVDANPSFIKKLFSNILDQAVILGVSAILLLVFDLLIGFIGYMVAEPTPVLLIIYVIVNVFYLPLFEAKNKRTIGKRILGIG